MKQNTLLALDLGETHTGVALYRPSVGITPLDGFSVRDIYQFKAKIEELIRDYEINTIVIGDMGLDSIPEPINSTLKSMSQKHNIKVKTVSERLSSFQAEKELGDGEVADLGQSGHSQAAVNILRDYLSK